MQLLPALLHALLLVSLAALGAAAEAPLTLLSSQGRRAGRGALTSASGRQGRAEELEVPDKDDPGGAFEAIEAGILRALDSGTQPELENRVLKWVHTTGNGTASGASRALPPSSGDHTTVAKARRASSSEPTAAEVANGVPRPPPSVAAKTLAVSEEQGSETSKQLPAMKAFDSNGDGVIEDMELVDALVFEFRLRHGDLDRGAVRDFLQRVRDALPRIDSDLDGLVSRKEFYSQGLPALARGPPGDEEDSVVAMDAMPSPALEELWQLAVSAPAADWEESL